MKYFVIAAGFATALGLLQSAAPAQAQSEEVRRICYNKHSLPFSQQGTASEARRKEAAAKYSACIRSGGKS